MNRTNLTKNKNVLLAVQVLSCNNSELMKKKPRVLGISCPNSYMYTSLYIRAASTSSAFIPSVKSKILFVGPPSLKQAIAFVSNQCLQ
jgi:hypothetical protein